MSYLGITGPTSGPSQNSYLSAGFFNQPHYLAIGTVLLGLQSGQYYDVALDGNNGRVLASYLGTGRGLLGVSEAGGILPGERVVVAVSFGSSMPSVIVAKMDYAKAGDYKWPCQQLTYPQVAGFAVGERMSGRTYSDYPRLQTMTTGLVDALDGEWHQHNMFGAGVGVEMFRSYIRGGPAAGLFCYSEDQHVRIMGAKLEFVTFGESSDDTIVGTTTSKVVKRYFYGGDQLAGFQAQGFDAFGPVFGGHQDIVTYPDGLNGSGPKEDGSVGESRVAMIHEHRGLDGSYILTAANSLTLQKWLEVAVPIDIREASAVIARKKAEAEAKAAAEAAAQSGEEEVVVEDTCGCDACELTADPIIPGVTVPVETPTEPGEEPETCVPTPNKTRFTTSSTPNPLAFAMNARGFAERLVIWQSIGGFGNLCDQWGYGTTPTKLYGGRTSKQLTWSKSSAMWKSMPQTVKLALTPDGQGKRFYFGRALISITEDGSIVLQDAQGSQIMMSGGNIYMSANHDVIRVAGRNLLDIAGRDAALRGGRHVEINANEGHLTAAAAGQVSVVGGRDGHSGVIIESQGNYHGTNETGENPATSGGVIIKARGFVGVSAGNITLRSRVETGWSAKADGSGSISLDSEGPISWGAEDSGGGFGNMVWAGLGKNSSDGFRFGRGTAAFNLDVITNKALTFRTMRRIAGRGADVIEKECYEGFARNAELREAWWDFQNNPLFMKDAFKVKWLTSAQYNMNSTLYFQIPEPEWQLRARDHVDSSSTILNSVMIDQDIDGTSPLPGNQRWNDGMAIIEYSSPNFNTTPVLKISVDNYPLDGSLLKGI
jgi:hypothetical protein